MYFQEVRLVDGEGSPNVTTFSGRVEVRLPGGSWGTVCDDSFDGRDASVICKMFGFKYAVPKRGAHFGTGVGNIHMDDLRCTGNESSIFDCRYAGWDLHNCKHSEDASVICSSLFIKVRIM